MRSDAPTATAALEALAAAVARALAEAPAVEPEALPAELAARLCGVKASVWRDWNARGLIPAPVQLGDSGRCPRWLRSELLAWLRLGAPARVRWEEMRGAALRGVA